MVARYDEQEWEDGLEDRKQHASELWDYAEAISWASGYPYNDRNGKRVHPNPEKERGLCEFALEIYNKGLTDGDYLAPYEAF